MDEDRILEKLIVGAYTSSPNLFGWDRDLENVFFKELKKLDYVRGLEIPFWGKSLHPIDDDYFLGILEPEWENVITCVPGTMKFLRSDPFFGLASVKQESRKKAIEFARLACYAIEKIVKHFDKQNIISVEITSSPKTTPIEINGDAEYLYDSLHEISKWNWHGAKLVIEHCDSFSQKNTVPQKGFLSLEDEVQVIRKVNSEQDNQIGLTINWGRSAIEDRQEIGPQNHVKYVSKWGILSGVMFSGVTENGDSLYGAWKDLHTPPAKAFDILHYQESSLMTYENIRNTLNSCEIGKLDYLGIKLLPLPSEMSISDRIGINRDAIFLIRKALTELT